MYSQLNQNELVSLLERNQTLTYQSRLKLLNEIQNREFDLDTSSLRRAISEDNDEIKQLKYLNNLGFELHYLPQLIMLKRASKAILNDVFTFIIASV